MAMGTVWQCDRCKKVAHDFGGADAVDLPENWVDRSMPVRGSEGARSHLMTTLCHECDDDLYDWLHYNERSTL